MNAKMIEALKGIRDNLNTFIEEAELQNKVVAETVGETIENEVESPVVKSRKEREASESIPDPNEGTLTAEQLDGLSYNNLKKLAKDMGIPAVGSREELTQKILNISVEIPEEVEEDTEKDDEVEEETSVDSVDPDTDEDEEDDEEDNLVKKVNEAVEDMTDEEIMDILADVGVKAKGKRQALISAVVKAVQDGKIDLDDEEVEEDEEDSADSSDDTSEEDKQEYGVNDLDNPDMTEERRTAIKDYAADVFANFKNGDLTRKQLVEWLNEFNGTNDSMKKKSDEEVLSDYVFCSCLLINDEGEMNEEEGNAYTVNGVPYCCGHELQYVEDNDTYICEVCGSEFEAGEE